MMKQIGSALLGLLLSVTAAFAATPPSTTQIPLTLIDPTGASAQSLIGVPSGGGGWQIITLGPNLSMTGSVLNASGSGGSSITIGSTAISGGTTTRVLYDNAGTVGEYSITGSGNVVLSTSPTLITPTLGVASATTINKVTITAPATGSTLTIADGKTLTDTSGIGASILLGATGGGFSAYRGATCTNQFVRVLSAAGAATCASVTNAFLTSGSFSNITGVGTLTSLTVSGAVQFSGLSGGSPAYAVCTDVSGNLLTASAANCYAGGSAGAGGSNAQVQYNSSGSLAADAAMTYIANSGILTLGVSGTTIAGIKMFNSTAGGGYLQLVPANGSLGSGNIFVPNEPGGTLATLTDLATALPATSALLYLGTTTAGIAQTGTTGTNLTLSGTTLSCTVATSSQNGCVQPDGTIITVTAGVITVAKGSATAFGAVEVDNTTITASAGVISVGNISGAKITSGVVGQAYGGAGTISGALKGNGSGTVSQAACADLSNGATGCAAATGTSGHTLPYLDGTNTYSGAQTFGTVYGTVTTQSGTTYTLAAADCGTEVDFTNASAVTVTIPATLATGCNIAILQTTSAGQVSVNGSAVSAATLHSAHSYTKTSGQWAIIGINIYTTGVAILTGDGA